LLAQLGSGHVVSALTCEQTREAACQHRSMPGAFSRGVRSRTRST
jgi:hypothetical protein